MVKSGNGKSHAEEEDEGDDYDSPSSRGEMAKDDGKSGGQKGSTHRSKHSESEQRRRSKINERFQILRELIPQNDQKRDKASFLLEVIGYIQFLQERLQRYEGPYNGWSQEPAKLIPWKNHPSETLVDHSQVLKNGSAHESTLALAIARSSMESDLEASAVFNSLNHSAGTTPSVQYNMLPDLSMFGAIGKVNGVSTLCTQGSTADAENMTHQIQSELWHGQPCVTECTAPSSPLSGQQLNREGGSSASISNAYSQGVLSSLAQALQSSGVDMSQTSIAVQINVDKRANHGLTASALSPPKVDEAAQYLNNQLMEEQTGFGSPADESDQQSCKRLRTENG